MKGKEEFTKLLVQAFDSVIQEEVDNPDFLAQEYFAHYENPCQARARAMLTEAMLRGPEQFLTIAIGKHREAEHGENHETETLEAKCLETLTYDQEQAAEVPGWWHH